MKNRILIIDDEPDFNQKLRIGMPGFDYTEALTIEDANRQLTANNYNLILLDLNLDPATDELEGLDLIRPIKAKHPQTPLVIVTSDEKTETVVTAMKLGADDFLRKSNFDILAWKKKFELLIENQALNLRIANIESEQFPFIGDSPEINEIKKALKILADNPDVTVLITGETGVGKEVAARYLHQHSKRCKNPFVPVNLSAIQDTLIESSLFGHKKGSFTGANYEREGFFRKANGGILFLDEIAEINPTMQVKILRFLESKTIQVVGDEKDIKLNVQIIIATNKDLKASVSAGKFREDLYYRIKNFQIEIPPLRYRKEDLKDILAYYMSRFGYTNYDRIISQDVKEKILGYDWPGNIRELKNAVDYMLLRKKIKNKAIIDSDSLPEEIQRQQDIPLREDVHQYGDGLNDSMKNEIARIELSYIQEALKRTSGQKQKAAQLLKMTLDDMRYRVKKYWEYYPEILEDYPDIKKNYKLGG